MYTCQQLAAYEAYYRNLAAFYHDYADDQNTIADGYHAQWVTQGCDQQFAGDKPEFDADAFRKHMAEAERQYREQHFEALGIEPPESEK